MRTVEKGTREKSNLVETISRKSYKCLGYIPVAIVMGF
jgi:hypothetical protein